MSEEKIKQKQKKSSPGADGENARARSKNRKKPRLRSKNTRPVAFTSRGTRFERDSSKAVDRRDPARARKEKYLPQNSRERERASTVSKRSISRPHPNFYTHKRKKNK